MGYCQESAKFHQLTLGGGKNALPALHPAHRPFEEMIAAEFLGRNALATVYPREQKNQKPQCLQSIQTMPMDRRVYGEVVLDKDFQTISLINVDKRSRLLSIDKIDFAGDAICKQQ